MMLYVYVAEEEVKSVLDNREKEGRDFLTTQTDAPESWWSSLFTKNLSVV